jgi:3'5'-cyclic nucleotide phosphodiesterase
MSVQKLLARIAAPSDGDLGRTNPTKAFLSSALHDHTYGITSDALTPFACAFAALIHDVDHEGVPNPRLIEEKPALAARYRQRSVAEQNSIQIAWDLLMESRFDVLRLTICDSESELRRFRELVVSGVLATDLGDKELKELRNNRWSKAFSKENGVRESHTAAINRKATIVIEHLIQVSTNAPVSLFVVPMFL